MIQSNRKGTDQGLNPGAPAYESEMVTIRPPSPSLNLRVNQQKRITHTNDVRIPVIKVLVMD